MGSLATDGAAETDVYLPRCDLGLVLIDAGAVPTPEDFALVQRLLRAGFAVQAAPLLAQLEALTATAPEGKAEAIARDLARLRGFVT